MTDNVNQELELEKVRSKSNIVYNVHFYSSFGVLIWFFACLLTPVVYNVGGILTPFYAEYNSALTLTPLGIISSIVAILWIVETIVFIIMSCKFKQHKYPNIENQKTNWAYYSILIIGFIIISLLVAGCFIPPKNHTEGYPGNFYTAVWGFNELGLFGNGLWYTAVVLFSLLIIYGFFAVLILWKINSNTQILEFIKNRKEIFREMIEKVKEAKKTKAENRAKRKRLLEEEDELLNNLNEVVIEEDEVAGLSQEELQAKINKHNEIKNKIFDLHKQQEELKLEANPFARKKEKTEVINKRATKVKKQEIAIPDKELEEIFKNLDID